MKSVLVVEGDTLKALGLHHLIDAIDPGLSVRTCHTPAEALRQMNAAPRDWHRVFLDLDLPGAGYELAFRIEELGLYPRTCVLSGASNEAVVREIHRMHFLGYIIKHAPLEEVEGLIRKILDGTSAFPSRPTSPLSHIQLSLKDLQILDSIRRGLKTKFIALEVNLAEGTVNNKIFEMVRKLEATNRSSAVSKAIQLGLLPPTGFIAETAADYR